VNCRHWCFGLYRGNHFEGSVHRRLRRGHCSCQFEELHYTLGSHTYPNPLPSQWPSSFVSASGFCILWRMPRSSCMALPSLLRRIAPTSVNHRPLTARRSRYECDRGPQHGAFWGIIGYLSCMTGLWMRLISNYFIYIRSSVPRHASTTGCTKGMGLLRTSQARDARCLCTCVSAIYTSKQ
jgi:hypothetical protein